ncbi:DUF2938 domain-containing protein [Variovorax dokdonensis]|uniref:DUF2938 domain-containing protein n=1 Tax=Variovorax dokdonensis TaxID=344883 RepID=A0ABT7N8J1_9BURK|nr:DUF2938 domain-containing protein [Variovorax dokdonensis]MDM0044250.1 DUF2938 domain-containing protein [Variovorax dokdonensis]
MQFADIATTLAVGLGATALMDLWLLLLQRAGVPTGSFALIGRWVGHFRQGRFAHDAIGKAPPIAGEMALGWLVHYATGVAYAGLLVGIVGPSWLDRPTVLPALVFGIATVIAPLFVMQPAMGAGFAASRTPTPMLACLRSLANHAVFGLGLFVSAAAVAWMAR